MSENASYCIEDLAVGMSASHTKTVTEADVVQFADLTGDNNPIHLDEAYAATTMFRTRIAHGMLTAGLISNVLGTKLPGTGAIYLSQTANFKAPVRLGDDVVVTATVSDLNEKRRFVTLYCECRVGDTVVLDGEARVMVPSRG